MNETTAGVALFQAISPDLAISPLPTFCFHEKVGLKLNIQKTKIMASGPTTSWEIGGETVETVSDFIFLGSKITTDGDCNHEIKRCSIQAMVFPVVMHGCESWTVKKN